MKAGWHESSNSDQNDAFESPADSVRVRGFGCCLASQKCLASISIDRSSSPAGRRSGGAASLLAGEWACWAFESEFFRLRVIEEGWNTGKVKFLRPDLFRFAGRMILFRDRFRGDGAGCL